MNELIKSPMNYVGGKYKLLPQILPLLPKQIDIFMDLFGGGLDVSLNVNANKVISNDIISPIIDFKTTVWKSSISSIWRPYFFPIVINFEDQSIDAIARPVISGK